MAIMAGWRLAERIRKRVERWLAMNTDYDGIIIGSGQHGLILGSYLSTA